MNKMTKKLIPDLRFAEFVNDGVWNVKILNELFNVFRGGVFSKADMDSNGKKDCIHYGELFTKYNEIIFKIISKSNKSDGFTSKVGDVLMPSSDVTPTGLAKASAIMIDDVILGGDMNILRPKVDVNSIYVSYLLNYAQNEIIKLVSGTTVKHIYPGQIINLSIPITPNLFEQQKIASCLSSLDQLITAQKEKLELLKNHKKGLMQNLFPQEGETVPKFRFPEFENDGDWEEKKLETLAKRGSGHTPNKQFPDYYNGGVNWVSLSDSKKLDNGYIYETNIQISMSGVKNSSAVLHPVGTVILSRDAGVGKSAVLNSEMAVSQHFIAWICDESSLSNWFLYYILQILKPVFENIAVGSTIKTIGLPYFKELQIAIPLISEQNKIADALLSLDKLIQQHSDKIEKLQSHKKGLMQGLFPKITN